MMKYAEKISKPTASFSLNQTQMQKSRFAPRSFGPTESKHEAPVSRGAPHFSYNFLNIPAYPPVQRNEPEDEELQMKPSQSCPGCQNKEIQAKSMDNDIVPIVQRQPSPDLEEEEVLQGKFLPIQRKTPNFSYNLMNLSIHHRAQPKLLVGPADDKYENEADRVAEKAMSVTEPSSLQRKAEEEELQTTPLADGITSLAQRKVNADEEEENLPAKPQVHRVSSDVTKDWAELEQPINQVRGSGIRLENGVRSRLEGAFGVDFGSVRIHSDTNADRLNRSIQARAFTTGLDIFLKQGEYRPGSSDCDKLLAHELAHVVQQNDGRMQRTRPMVMSQSHSLADPFEGNSPMQSAPRVLQRMAVMAVTDLNQQKDSLVWNNLQYAQQEAGGPIGDLQKNKVWDQLQNNEHIRIVEHGAIKKIGIFDGKQIVTSMTQGDHKIPSEFKSGIQQKSKIDGITFQSCHAGVEASGSLVSETIAALNAEGFSGVPVTGRTGIAFGFKGMGEATAETDTGNRHEFGSLFGRDYIWVNPELNIGGISQFGYGKKAYYDAMYSLKDAKTIAANGHPSKNIFSTPFKYNDPWTLLGIKENEWYQMNSKTRANHIADAMEAYWQEIKNKMFRKDAFKRPSEATISSTLMPEKIEKKGWWQFWK